MVNIVKIPGTYSLPENVNAKSNEARFDFIFTTGQWSQRKNVDSVSGRGSTEAYTRAYRQNLAQFLGSNPGLTFFDAPCGDLNWVLELIEAHDMTYLGGDISGELITHLQERHPSHTLFKFDIIHDSFPTADIWHCRHCLMHLSLADVMQSLQNFASSKIPYALITNHFLPDVGTFDIPTGSYRPLSLTNYPFYLPNPEAWLPDTDLLSGETIMATGIWTREQIASALQKMPRPEDWAFAD